MSSEAPFVSIVVPTRNRAALLADCLSSLNNQDYPRDRFEVIVVDDGSVDSTRQAVQRFQRERHPEIRYIRQDAKGPNAARNAGISIANGDPICLLDDDVDIPTGWLREMVRGAIRHPDAGALGGPIRVRFEGTPPRFCGREPLVGEGEIDFGPEEREVPEVASGNMAIRRWALEKVGLFDESLPIYGDELEWERRLARAGHAIVYVPAAWLWHRRTDLRIGWLVRRYFQRGTNFVASAQRTGECPSYHEIGRLFFSSLAHGVRRRCAMGFLMMIQQLGILYAMSRRKDSCKTYAHQDSA